MKSSDLALAIVGAIAALLIVLLASGQRSWGGRTPLSTCGWKVDLAADWPTSLSTYESTDLSVNGVCLGLSRQGAEQLLEGRGFYFPCRLNPPQFLQHAEVGNEGVVSGPLGFVGHPCLVSFE